MSILKQDIDKIILSSDLYGVRMLAPIGITTNNELAYYATNQCIHSSNFFRYISNTLVIGFMQNSGFKDKITKHFRVLNAIKIHF